MKRVLILTTTTGYQTRMFERAAERQRIELLFASDRCDQLDDPWRDGAIPVRYHEEWRSADAVLKVVEQRPVNGVLALGDRPTVLAAHLARLLHLPGNPPEAATAARDKRLARDRFRRALLAMPATVAVNTAADPRTVLPRITFPCVLKPTVLSGSRGVIRADDADGFASAFERIRRLLDSADVKELRDPEAQIIQIEEFIPGEEFALEGVMTNGAFRTLALFDKPDPLDGPFFEETIYVTPSSVPPHTQAQIAATVERAARALDLHHGPIHAECRVNQRGVFILEVAARPIGGLCARALRFTRHGESLGLEDLLLLHAAGEPIVEWQREGSASGVMMIPIPRTGIFRGVDDVDAALAVPGVEDVQITAKPDQQMVAAPEGSSYLGFIFARGERPDDVDRALRAAHARLHCRIEPLLPIAHHLAR
jgi:biotin carboxylase